MRVIFFNGPPGCGKDTASRALVERFPHCYGQKFAKPLEEGVRAFYGLGALEYHELREKRKNEPVEQLLGKSMRQVMISLSEHWAKPLHDAAVFGKLAIHRLPAREKPCVAVFSDCGFQAEVDVVSQHVGKENCLLVRIHREGCTYKDDSRSYIEPNGMQFKETANNGTEIEFRQHIVAGLKKWVLI